MYAPRSKTELSAAQVCVPSYAVAQLSSIHQTPYLSLLRQFAPIKGIVSLRSLQLH